MLGLRVRAGTPYRAVRSDPGPQPPSATIITHCRRFEDSPHVAHLRVFRDKYIQGSYINEDGKRNKNVLEISVVYKLYRTRKFLPNNRKYMCFVLSCENSQRLFILKVQDSINVKKLPFRKSKDFLYKS